ncbi:SDR family NAD(P)-dependent oxidoreductase [Dactylosporangium sp. CA-233914]|uniref:SDR family NAD(P)-dependent oxidoreductase n=1 Tax=Dactylosporangium sp. CA-233914 TaxID=3239934 RepID=UPI003D8B6649
MSRVWFITGGSGGFGSAFAEAALEAGDRVVVTARHVGRSRGERVLRLPLDVTDPRQVHDAVDAAVAHFGRVDVLVNNAGRGWFGSVEGMDWPAVRDTFELNFFGLVSVTRAVLPFMRARGRGWIVNMSSVAGVRAVPGFGFYSAAKHAVEGLTSALRSEVEPFGIRVMLVEPGAFRTRAYEGFAGEPVAETVDAYEPFIAGVRDALIAQHGQQPGDPRRGARAVIAAMAQEPPPARLVLGSAAFDAVTSALEEALAGVRACEPAARSADYPP